MKLTNGASTPISEDDFRWLTSGIRYLFEIDAKTSRDRDRLENLLQRVDARMRQAIGWHPQADELAGGDSHR